MQNNENEVVYLYLDDIIPNRFQPRQVFDEKALKELAVSIKEHGVIQPIIVRNIGNKYEIIAGERRYKASALAGLTKIPAIVRNLDDKESSKVALLENLQRKNLNPIEEARTYQKILELDQMTQEELAKTMGKSQSAVANKLRLLSLTGFVPNIKDCVNCKEKENIKTFSLKDNGFKCEACSRQDTSAINISKSTQNAIKYTISAPAKKLYSFELKDSSDYNYIFNTRTKREPRNIMGRGLLNNDGIHEFQTANIVENENELNEYLAEFINNQKVINQKKAKRIPILPKIIRLDDVKDKIGKLDSIPIGISKNDLEVITYDFTANIGNVISSNKLANTYKFILSLLEILNSVIGTNLIVIDSVKTLNLDTNIYKNYFNNEFDMILDKINQMIESYISNKMQVSGIVLIYGVDKFLAKLNDRSKFDRLLKNAKKYEKISIIIVEDTGKLKLEMYNSWFTENFVVTDGIWIGKGVADSLFKIATISKELLGDMKNNMGFFVLESMTTKIKLIDFISKEETGDNNE